MRSFVQAFRDRTGWLKTVDFLIGSTFCAALAVLVCLLVPMTAQKATIPFIFTIVIVAVSMRYGAGAGVLGCILSAAIFAMFLFNPLGSVAVSNPAAKNNLFWMILLGIPGSYLFAPFDGERAERTNKDR